MSLSIDSQCLLCHMERNIQLVRPLGTEEQTMAFARDLMRMYLEAPADVSSPWFNPQVAELLHQHYGLPLDRFRQEKAESNRFVLERMEDIRSRIARADDPVLAGLQFAILGNYLDFSALRGQVSFDKLSDMLDQALNMELDQEVYRTFRRQLEEGKKLLYLTDNAGEIGFDRLFAEEIAKAHPQLEITFCVRGGPAHNDATREDAKVVGIPFPVIDNGNTVGGTELSLLSKEAKEAMDEADVILAKGMGNAETLYGSGYPIFYAFLIKCPHFQDFFQKPMMTPMFIREKR